MAVTALKVNMTTMVLPVAHSSLLPSGVTGLSMLWTLRPGFQVVAERTFDTWQPRIWRLEAPPELHFLVRGFVCGT